MDTNKVTRVAHTLIQALILVAVAFVVYGVACVGFGR